MYSPWHPFYLKIWQGNKSLQFGKALLPSLKVLPAILALLLLPPLYPQSCVLRLPAKKLDVHLFASIASAEKRVRKIERLQLYTSKSSLHSIKADEQYDARILYTSAKLLVQYKFLLCRACDSPQEFLHIWLNT